MRLFWVFLFIIIASQSFSQNQDPNNWIRTYGGKGYDWGVAGYEVEDRKYIIASSSSSTYSGNKDIMLMKIDSLGDEIWRKFYGGDGIDWVKNMIVCSDGGYALTGFTNSKGLGGYDVLVFKVDKEGELEWEKTFGGADWDFSEKIIETQDGGFVIVGHTYSFGSGDADVYLLKIDSLGNYLWSKTFGGIKKDIGYGIIEFDNNDLIIVGQTESFSSDTKAYIIQTDKDGNLKWNKIYGNTPYAVLYDLKENLNKEIVVCGSISNNTNGDLDFYFFKINEFGVQQWEVIEGGAEDDEFYSMLITSNNDLIFVGSTASYGIGGKDAYSIIYLDGGGFRANTFGKVFNDEVRHITPTTDNGYLMVGSTASFGPGRNSIFINKADSIKGYDTTVVVNVNEIKLKNDLNRLIVYPNPFSKKSTLTIPESFFNYSLNIHSASGIDVTNMFKISKLTNNKVEIINCNNLSGMFFYNVFDYTKLEGTNGKFLINSQ
jgi:hypothetical protein